MLNSDIIYFLSIITSVLHKASFDCSNMSSSDIDAVYKLATMHQMTTITAFGLEMAGVQDDRFKNQRIAAILTMFYYDAERDKIISALIDKQIWFVLLKGLVLRECYPVPVMRQMSDNDILFDEEKAGDVREIMESFGFTTTHYNTGYQDDYQKSPFFHFEMHRMLFDPITDKKKYEYFKNVKDKLIGDGLERHFTNEDFYIYMIAHEYKHFEWRGAGFRYLLDVYCFLDKYNKQLNWNYIFSEIKKIGIDQLEEFEKTNRILALKIFGSAVFDPEKLTPDEKVTLETFCNSGIHGTDKIYLRNKQQKVEKIGKGKYLIKRLFIPMEAIKWEHPFFYKYKILIPFLPFYRAAKGWKNVKKEISILLKK